MNEIHFSVIQDPMEFGVKETDAEKIIRLEREVAYWHGLADIFQAHFVKKMLDQERAVLEEMVRPFCIPDMQMGERPK